MSKTNDKTVFLNTIRYSPWLLLFVMAVLLGSLYFEGLNTYALLLGIPIGLVVSWLLPVLWRKNNDWLGFIILFCPFIYALSTGKADYALQTLLFSLVVSCTIWILFKQKVTRFILGSTE